MEPVRLVPTATHYPKTADASIEALRRLAGIVSLTRPVPKTDIFEDDEDFDADDEAPNALF
jgi:hypothetical protein